MSSAGNNSWSSLSDQILNMSGQFHNMIGHDVRTFEPEEDSNLFSLTNWQPITLLNLDYKIASKVMAKRLERVLKRFINPDQTGFIKGR